MFKCAIGHSDDIDTNDAVKEALGMCEKALDGLTPKAALVYAGIDYNHEEMIRLIVEKYPGIVLSGCTTDGEFSSQKTFTPESILIALFASDTIQFRSGIGVGISIDPKLATLEAIQKSKLDDLTPSLIAMASDGLTGSGDAVIRGLTSALPPNVPIVGGAAGDKRRIKYTVQFHESGIQKDSVTLLAFYGDLNISFGVESGWESLGKRVLVTKSDGHVVKEIDNKTALEFYKNYMGEYVRGSILPAYPLGVWPSNGDPFYVRSPIFIDENSGTVIFSGEVLEGDEVQMMQVDRPNIIKGAKASIAKAMKSFPGEKPSMVFSISCTTRNEMLGTKVFEEAKIVQEGAGLAPVFGFYAYGEYSPIHLNQSSRFHNETCITVAIGEK